MFSNVVHCLLGDPENDDLEGRGYVAFFDLDLPLDLNIRVGRLKCPAEPGKASQETQIIKDGWPQVHLYSSAFLDTFLNQGDDDIQIFCRTAGRLSDLKMSTFHLEFNCGQVSSEGIMNLAGDPLSLLLVG